MKKAIAIALVMFLLIFSGCSSTKSEFVVHNYTRAIIKFPDGSVQDVRVKEWANYTATVVSITDENGVGYLISLTNCVLIGEDEA